MANDIVNHDYVMEPPESPKRMEFRRAFRMLNTRRFGESVEPGKDMEALHPLPIPCPMHLFHAAIPELCLFIINQ